MLFDAVCELSPDQQQARLSEMQASELEIERVQKLLQIDITPGDISTLPNVIELMATSVPTAMLTNVVTPSCLLNFA